MIDFRRWRHSSVVCVAALCVLAAGGLRGLRAQSEEPADHEVHEAADASAEPHGNEAEGDGQSDGHAGVDYNQPPLDVHLPLLIWSIVVFGVYLVVAKKVAWVPLISGLDSREARVNRALAEAETARAEAAKLLAEQQAQLDEVTEQVKEIIAAARGEAEQEKARAIAEAETETTAMRDQAISEIHAAHEQALEGLDERIDAQVQTAREHVLG